MRKAFDNAKLSQSACLLEGLCINLHRTRGNFCVIIHSYKDCANIFPRAVPGGLPSSNGRIFCTNISESDVMAGTTLDRLERCIRLVAEEKKPEAIYVFASCATMLIGDDIEGCAASVAADVSMPVVAVTASGFDDISQYRIIEWHAELMHLAGDKNAEIVPRSVNLLGYPEDATGEIARTLESAGIKVNAWVQGCINGSSPLSEWKKLRAGSLNVVMEKELYGNLLETMKNENGIDYIEAPVPVGYSGTEKFYKKIAAKLGMTDEMKKATDGARKKAKTALDKTSKKLKGRKMAYSIGTDRNYEPHRVAMDGLAEAPFFMDLGVEIVVLIQGSPDPNRQLHINRQLKEMNIQAGFDIFVDNASLRPTLEKTRYDFIYCIESMAEMVGPTRTPMIGFGRLAMGYEGLLRNLDYIEREALGAE